MKASIRKILSLIIPLFLGLGIIYYQYTTLSSEELQKIKICFQKADYLYIYLSLLISLFGYWSRAYRWKFSLNHLGYQTHFKNDFLTVCVSYLVNLTIPRSGEISRAALLKKYENVPFDKGFGTIVAERIVDLLLFLLFVGLAFVLQFEKLYAFICEKISIEKILLFIALAVLAGVGFVFLWIYAEWKIIIKLKDDIYLLFTIPSSCLKFVRKWLHAFVVPFSFFLSL